MFRRLFDGVREEDLTCDTPLGALHAVIYSRPDAAAGQTVIIVPPDGEERAFALRPLVTAARALAASGRTVVRFDFGGQGMTDGDYAETTVASRISDLERIWQESVDRFHQPAVILAVRLGASIAIAAAPGLPGLKQLVAVEPVLDTGAYLQSLLRVAIATQMVVHGKVLRDRGELISAARAGERISVNGFNLSGTFIDELLSLNLRERASRWDGNVLALTGGVTPPAWTSMPGWRFMKFASMPFWREPKIHNAATPAFVPAAMSWLDELHVTA